MFLDVQQESFARTALRRLIAICALAFALPAGAQVVFDAASNAATATASTANPITVSWNHTVGSANNAYIVASISLKLNGGTATVTGVTYGTETGGPDLPMTVIGAANNGTTTRAELWGLANPTPGTHQITVSVTNGGGQNVVVVAGAKSFTNVLAAGSAVTATGNSVTPSVAMTNNPRDYVVDAVAFNSNVALTAGANQTNAYNVTNSAPTFSGAGSAKTGFANTTMSWTAGAAQAWAECAAPLVAATPAILFDAVSGASVASAANPVTLAWNHTTGTGANRYIVAAIAVKLNGGTVGTNVTITGVTYGGTPMTFLGRQTRGTSVNVELWGLAAPASGTQTISVTVSNTGMRSLVVSGGAQSFSNVDQIAPTGTPAGANNNIVNPTVVVTSAATDYLVDVVGFNTNAVTLQPGTLQDQRWNFLTASPIFDAASSGSHGYVNASMNWDSSATTANWAIEAIPLKRAAVVLTQSASAEVVEVGGNVTYTLTATNFTSATVNNVTITDAIPAGATFVSQTGCGGTGPVTCNIGSLAAGATSAPITVTVQTTTAGAISNVATVKFNGSTIANTSDTLTTQAASRICATPGKDGAGGTLAGVKNDYWPGATTAASGATSVTLGTRATGGAGNTIAAGDLLIVMQMQDAAFDTTNDASYGAGNGSTRATGNGYGGVTSLNNAGRWEYVVATNSITAAGGSLTFSGSGPGGGLLFGYTAQSFATTTTQGQRTWQVIRVPQYTIATLGSTLTALAWNGATGGVLAIDVSGTLNLGGATVSVNGLGFRGGGGRLLVGDATPGLSATDLRTLATQTANGSKGEGIAGTPRYVYRHGATIGAPSSGNTPLDTGVEGYASGSYARGAPGNAGGGSTSADPTANTSNSGGGGGGNAGFGGGGGFPWNCPSCISGGEGGGLSSFGSARITLGGGGGAGATNNASAETCIAPPTCRQNVPGDWIDTEVGTNGYYSSGANGGGIMILRALQTSGTATLTANGLSAYNAGRDGAGGGGAGGVVVVTTQLGSLSGLTIQAKGGSGGSAWLTTAPAGDPGERHGPGGGGGGGLVVVSSAAGSINVSGGVNGVTTTVNDAFGAQSGGNGASVVGTGFTGTSGASCATADLSVTNTDSPDPVVAGSNITYAQALTNNGPNTADQATFATNIPPYTTYQSMTVPPGWTCITPAVNGTGIITCTSLTIANAATANFSVVVKTLATAPPGFTISNTATASSSTTDTNPSNDSATATTTIVVNNFADVSLSVSGAATVVANTNISYTQTVRNGGGSAAANISFTETTPPNTTFQSVTPPAGWTCITPAVGGTGTINCTASSSIAVGNSVSIPFTLKINAGTTSGTAVTLTATVSCPTDPNVGNNTASSTTVVVASGSTDFATTAAALNNPVVAGGLLSFGESVVNNGVASGNATFTQTVPANTTFYSLTVPASWTCAPPAVGGTGTFNCTTSVAAAAGSSFAFVATYKVNPTTATGTVITLTTSVTAALTDSITANNTATATARVGSATTADVAIAMTDSPDPIEPGQVLSYQITVTNKGAAAATNVSVTDTLPAGLVTPPSISTTNGSCAGTTTISCAIATLAAGASATITITAQTSTSGTKTNTASVSATETDDDLSNNSATVTTDVLVPLAAANDSATVFLNSANNVIDVLVNDTAGTTVASVAGPSHGTATTTGTNIRYTPASGYSGTDSFTYTITDGHGTATATVNITVVLPVLTIGNASLTEGNSGSAPMNFTVTLSPASSQTVTVQYATANGTATVADSDYAAASGTLTFTPGATTQTIGVNVNGDTRNEIDETFTVTLASPANASIATATGTGTIVNDDPQPSLSIANVSQNEGDTGTTTFNFTVTLSAVSGQAVSVNYGTADGTATLADGDYASASGTLTFPPGVTTRTIPVTVTADRKFEPTETFAINLSSAVNATIATAAATGTITNDDALPSISIGNVSQSEGNSGTTQFSFAVTLSNPSYQTITVNYATGDGTATTADNDYAATSGTLTFAPGVTAQTINVTVNGDARFEPNETFSVTLASPSNATIAAGTGTGTIVNDDAVPSIAIGNLSQAEGNSGITPFTFTVTLSNPSSQTITVNYATANGTATTADNDYAATSGTLTYAPGVTSQTITVNANGDPVNEADETFSVDLSMPSNATIATPAGTGTIANDDLQPSLSIASVSQDEGNSGTTAFNFVVTLSAMSGQTVTAAFATADGTATTAGNDYAAASGVVTFAPGVTSQTIAVTVNGDTTNEADETFTVNLSSPSNATLVTATGTGTIRNDDAVPSLSIGNASLSEGNSGTSNMTFTATLSAASGQTVTVNYATADGTAATGNADYASRSGTLTFAPGVSSQTISVPIIGDTVNEPDETFTVTLATPSNATIALATGTGTIVNDDAVPSLSINSVSQPEGNSGTSNMIFTVTLSAASAQTVTVDFATADGSATAGSDYTAAGSTLTFNPGETIHTISIPIDGDVVSEGDETFTVSLGSPSNATILAGTGTGTILDDDGSPSLSINSVSQAEGDSGSANMTFTVTLSPASAQTVTVNYASADGTASAGSDYTAVAGTLTFVPGETTHTIDVPIAGDTTSESNETFSIVLSSPANAAIVAGTGNGTIVNDDAAPSLTINSVMQPEGNSGGSLMTFTVTLSAASGQTVTVNYATADGTATAGSDYTAVSSTLTFAPGVTTRTIAVPIAGDAINEPDESFAVVLSSPVNATILAGTGIGTIQNDDAAPSLSINSVSMPEGNSGTAPMTFMVSLSAISAQTVTVNYATADGTATAAAGAPGNPDYIAAGGTLTFAPGVTSQTIAIPIVGDTVPEGNESFTVVLSSPSNATILTGTGTGTILDDDGTPSLSINNVSQLEGDSGTSNLNFTVTLSPASAQTVTVQYATANGTATAGSDYSALSGTLTFAPGVTTQTIAVPINGDSMNEADESFTVGLSLSSNATILVPTGTGTIQNDDAAPSLSINSVAQPEGNAGTSNMVFNVALSAASGQTITVNYSTADGTATAGSDYTAVSGTLTFPAGSIAQTITVPIAGDTITEGDENFMVILGSPANATISAGTGIGTIQNDDAPPSVSINSISVPEGNGGTTPMTFTVSLSNMTAQTVTVSYATANGTATAGSDYAPASGIITFAPGTVTQPVAIQIIGDTIFEGNETFTVNLSSPSNASIATATGTGTILDDDGAPSLSINSVAQAEGNSGTNNMIFMVTLSPPSGQMVTVNYATANGTATAGTDYTAVSSSLTFAPGVTTQTIAVPILGDTAAEPDESFAVNLSSPSNATLLVASGTGTIQNDDSVPTLSINSVAQPEGNVGTSNMIFTVTLSPSSAQTVTVNYATTDGTATAGSDYTSVSGTLTFPPGTTTQSITVPIIGGTVTESDEDFMVILASPTNAVIGSGTGVGTIQNDDGVPSASINSVAVAEGNSGTAPMTFTVTLSNISTQTVTIAYATSDGTATSGGDYNAVSGLLIFPPGTITQTISVPIIGDAFPEGNETFTVNLSSPSNATIATATGTGTILDDDGTPSLSIDSLSRVEGNVGTTAMTFTVTLFPPSAQTVTVNYASANGTATAGSDYTAVSGTLTFPPATTAQTIAVPIAGDTTLEPDETFTIALSSPVNATILAATGVGTILNDDSGSADLAISQNAPANATQFQNASLNLTVTNLGPNTATSVVVTDQLPAGAVLVSATPSQGSCSGSAPIACSMGSMASGATATVVLIVTFNSVGPSSNSATVSVTPQTDPNAANNSATASVSVQPAGARIPTMSGAMLLLLAAMLAAIGILRR